MDDEQKTRFKQLANMRAYDTQPKILKIGSLKNKYSTNTSKSSYEKDLKNYAKNSKNIIILAASTHENEEVLIANAILKASYLDQFLIIFAFFLSV